MTRDEWFNSKFLLLKRFAWTSFAGVLVLMAAIYFNISVLALLGAIAVVPFLFWLGFIPVLHWRERYVGTRIAVWGAFLVFETSGWSKLVYWFRHVLPLDYRKQGRYSDIP
jgi:hypothetical protein